MILSSTLRMQAHASSLTPPVTTLEEMVTKDVIVRLLEGPLAETGNATKAVLLRGLASMAERVLGQPMPHITRAAKRAMKRALRTIVPGRQRSYEDYRDIVLELRPYMLPGDAHDRETALLARCAASLGIAVELALRRTELTSLTVSDLLIDRPHGVVDVIVRKALRKNGDTFQARLSPSIAEMVIDYVDQARPFLIDRVDGEPTDALWVSSTGGPLCPEGLINEMQFHVKRVLGVTASAILFRRATASRTDILENETFLWLHHAHGSTLGQELYAARDRGEGQRILLDAWG